MTELSAMLLRDVVHEANHRGASDVHLVPGHPVALRISGRLEIGAGPSLTADTVAHLASLVFDDSSRAGIARGRDATVTISPSEEQVVFRVHGYRTHDGTALAIRLLPTMPPAIDTLGLPDCVLDLAGAHHGLIIFAGPTGSGKTTSLAALVDRINAQQTRRIVTIEDPIEYRHACKRSSIVQREVPSDTPSFDTALLGALRADPDVILVGEMRDVATMRAVLSAAETGHLVLTTLHTLDAPGTIDRLIDAFPGGEQAQVRSQVAATMRAVVCQQLVSLRGDRGRRCVAEVLLATDAVRAMIRDGRTYQLRNAIATSRSAGMQTIEHHLGQLL